MKYILVFIIAIIALPAFSAVEKTGQIKSVQIWGNIAKASVCQSDDTCSVYWVGLGDSKGQSVLSMWLAAHMAKSSVYIQGFAPDKPEHPYSNASKFYGMNLK